MKVLVATTRTQGDVADDFCWTVEGELVRIGSPCASDEAGGSGRCGCGRAFEGLSSVRATTTAQVRDLPISRADYRDAFGGYLDAAGWAPYTDLDDEVERMLAVARTWPVGTVVRRHLARIGPAGRGSVQATYAYPRLW